MAPPTPHISAPAGAFARVVLLPGDPLRAEYIARHHLEGAELVTAVRNMLGFTGTHEGTPVSVMGSGMGIPSLSIYATELIRDYGVSELIRVGSCGGLTDAIDLRDIIVAIGASTDSGVNRRRIQGFDLAAVADYDLVRRTVDAADRLGRTVHVGPIFSSDLFYAPEADLVHTLAGLGILGIEMEAAGLYGIAAEEGVKALTIATVSDHLSKGGHLSSDERQTSFDEMIELALHAAVSA